MAANVEGSQAKLDNTFEQVITHIESEEKIGDDDGGISLQLSVDYEFLQEWIRNAGQYRGMVSPFAHVRLLGGTRSKGRNVKAWKSNDDANGANFTETHV